MNPDAARSAYRRLVSEHQALRSHVASHPQGTIWLAGFDAAMGGPALPDPAPFPMLAFDAIDHDAWADVRRCLDGWDVIEDWPALYRTLLDVHRVMIQAATAYLGTEWSEIWPQLQAAEPASIIPLLPPIVFQRTSPKGAELAGGNGRYDRSHTLLPLKVASSDMEKMRL